VKLDTRERRDTVGGRRRAGCPRARRGLYAPAAERTVVVTDIFDNGRELVDAVSEGAGTRISRRLSRAVAAAKRPLMLHQDVWVRLLRAVGG
jgi:hypothetical protein